MTRLLVIFCAALAALFCVPEAWALKIVHSQPRKMERTAFTRLGDFFGFHSPNPTRVTVFTNPNVHTGLFFEIELDTALGKIPDGYSAKLELITQGDKTPREFTFKIPANHSHAKALYLGLTDPPFTSKATVRIFAWRASILDKDNKVVSSDMSPLWQY